MSSVPVFLVDDVNATAHWYREQLGFAIAGIFPPHGAASWASLQRDGAEIMLQRLQAYIRLTGVARLYETVKGKPLVCKIVDLNGYVLVFGGDETIDEAQG